MQATDHASQNTCWQQVGAWTRKEVKPAASTIQTGYPNASTTITLNTQGRYVRVQLSGTNYLALAEVQVFGTSLPNVAQGKTATQSSTYGGGTGASNAVDGNTDGNFSHGSITHTNLDANAWWQVDLGTSATVGSIS